MENTQKTFRSNSLTSQEFIELEEKWCAHNYRPIPVVLTEGKGVWVWDVEGKKYLDMMSAYSAVSHGHCNPKLLSALTEQANRLSMCSRAYYTDVLPLFLQKLCFLTNMDCALPMNTGAEAVETTIKAVRRWGYFVKKIPENKAEIIVMARNFHGRTTGIISFSSDTDYKHGFGPFLPGFKEIPFGDTKALEAAITPHTCAVLTEPVQGEAGVIVPPKGWLTEVSNICKKHNVLLIVDEVQSGFGRTGKMFACQHENVQPDGMILGKALGGGFFPVSALVGKDHLMRVFTPGSHGSTFGGNPLGAAVALRALELTEEEKLPERSAELGDYLMFQLKAIQSPCIQDVRGQGLWIGLDIKKEYASARLVCEKLKENGVLSKETHETVVRLAPPLVISREELDWGIGQIRKTIENL
ncbi:MAG: ornithine--oxo-acid transaminase [Alphaproteobacteria bacterium]|nr:ornithine--oxo-acid transaminase [Alphaproteobacteria bacterium]